MAEDTQNGAAGATPETPAGPSFSVEKIYVKDVSFEVPGAPMVFSEQAQPQLQLNLNQRVQRLGENSFEVVLGVTLTCNANDKPLYLAEVQQGGVFNLRGFEPQTLDAMLGIQCPHVLYPYARQLVSDLVQAGGFPPFYLQPINFEGLYAEGLRQRAAQGQQQANEGLAGSETAGNA
ncbi:MAG TPA: protein-export chaperone SecB [Xanthomonadaceae bacterium]|nr:protein-export chaperone SecB [Xanthomonadaceae bacterium]